MVGFARISFFTGRSDIRTSLAAFDALYAPAASRSS